MACISSEAVKNRELSHNDIIAILKPFYRAGFGDFDNIGFWAINLGMHLPGLNSFERHLASFVDEVGLQGSRLILAISGGRDSMALLRAFRQVAPRRDLELLVAHVHHGGEELFRKEAQTFVRTQVGEIPFITNPSSECCGSSELAMREFRHQLLERFRVENNCHYTVLAHHAEDLLETRLMRLVRGTGPLGLVAMNQRDGKLLRPLLKIEPSQIAQYVEQREVDFIEDPTNRNTTFFRNWIRNDWLSDLEEHSPGAKKRLALSLEALAGAVVEVDYDFPSGLIDRKMFEGLDQSEKLNLVAAYLKMHQVRDFTRNQILELIKRLNSRQKRFDFRLAKNLWCVNEHSFGLSRSSGSIVAD